MDDEDERDCGVCDGSGWDYDLRRHCECPEGRESAEQALDNAISDFEWREGR